MSQRDQRKDGRRNNTGLRDPCTRDVAKLSESAGFSHSTRLSTNQIACYAVVII